MASNNQRKARKNADYAGQHIPGQMPIPPPGTHVMQTSGAHQAAIYNMSASMDAGHANSNQFAQPQFHPSGPNPTMRFRLGEVQIEQTNGPQMTTIHRHPQPNQGFPPPAQIGSYTTATRPPPICPTGFSASFRMQAAGYQGYQQSYFPALIQPPYYIPNQQADYVTQQLQPSSIIIPDVASVPVAQQQQQPQQSYKSKKILKIVDPETKEVTNEKEINENEALMAAATEKQRVQDVIVSKTYEQPKDSVSKTTTASQMFSLKVAQSMVADNASTPASSASVPPQSDEALSIPPPSRSAPPADIMEAPREEVKEIEMDVESKEPQEIPKVEENTNVEPNTDTIEVIEKANEVDVVNEVPAEKENEQKTENEPSSADKVISSEASSADRKVDIVLEEAEKEEESAEAVKLRKQSEVKAAIIEYRTLNSAAVLDYVYDRVFILLLKDWTESSRMDCLPTDQTQLKDLGIDIRSAPPPAEKQRKYDVSTAGRNLYPPWLQAPDKAASKPKYHGRSSDRGSHATRDRKRPGAVGRPSIDRPVREPVELHKSEKAWRRGTVDDPVQAGAREVRELLNKITPSTFEELSERFLAMNVTSNNELMDQVISIIFDKAVDEPKFCPLYCNLLKRQVVHEEQSSKSGFFRAGILLRCQTAFESKRKKPPEIPDDLDEKKKEEMRQELEEQRNKERRRNFGNISFIGHLYRQQLIVPKILHWCLIALLRTQEGEKVDEDNVECAIRMLETVGPIADSMMNEKKLTSSEKEKDNLFDCAMYFDHLSERLNTFTGRIRFLIMNLLEARANNWKTTKQADGPKTLSQLHNEALAEEEQNKLQREQYDKKQQQRYDGRPSMEKRKPSVPQRQSQDGRSYGKNADSRDKARAAANMAGILTNRKNQSLNSVDQPCLLGAGRPPFSGGSCGGGVKESERANNVRSGATNSFRGAGRGVVPVRDSGNRFVPETFRKQSRDEERSEKFQSVGSSNGPSLTSRAAHTGIAASGSSPSLLSMDNKGSSKEGSELPGDTPPVVDEEKLLKPIKMDVSEYLNCGVGLNDVAQSIIQYADKYPVRIIFKYLIKVGVESVGGDVVSEKREKVGALLCKCLQLAQSKDASLLGICDYVAQVIDSELWDDYGHIWEKIAEIITRSISCDVEMLDGVRPSLGDFKQTFVQARNYEKKPNGLLVTVLMRLAEIEYKQSSQVSTLVMAFDELKSITNESLMDDLGKSRLPFANDRSLREMLNEEA